MAHPSINGKTVLIAGGAKSLGGPIARDLARQGAKAVVVPDNSAGSTLEAGHQRHQRRHRFADQLTWGGRDGDVNI